MWPDRSQIRALTQSQQYGPMMAQVAQQMDAKLSTANTQDLIKEQLKAVSAVSQAMDHLSSLQGQTPPDTKAIAQATEGLATQLATFNAVSTKLDDSSDPAAKEFLEAAHRQGKAFQGAKPQPTIDQLNDHLQALSPKLAAAAAKAEAPGSTLDDQKALAALQGELLALSIQLQQHTPGKKSTKDDDQQLAVTQTQGGPLAEAGKKFDKEWEQASEMMKGGNWLGGLIKMCLAIVNYKKAEEAVKADAKAAKEGPKVDIAGGGKPTSINPNVTIDQIRDACQDVVARFNAIPGNKPIDMANVQIQPGKHGGFQVSGLPQVAALQLADKISQDKAMQPTPRSPSVTSAAAVAGTAPVPSTATPQAPNQTAAQTQAPSPMGRR